MIEIKPAPKANPEGRLDLPWNVFRDGRHSTIQPSRDAAEAAASRLAEKYNLESFDEELVDPPKDYLSVVNTGAPAVGSRVKETTYLEDEYVGKVVGHLATQFIIETESGATRIVHNDATWELVA